MRLIKDLEELKTNINELDKYLNEERDPEYGFVLELIKRGTCFIAVKEEDTYKFYPSRFIGYACNNMDAHLNNKKKDGRETNPMISKILGDNPIPNEILNNSYKEYCESLGFIANENGSFGVERKYWEV